VGRTLRRNELVTAEGARELSLLDLRITARVDVTIEAGRLVARPRSERWYTLDELLRDEAGPQGDVESCERGMVQRTARR